MPITSLDTRQIPGDLLKFADVLIQDGVVHLRGAFKPQLLDALYKEYELGLLDVLQGSSAGASFPLDTDAFMLPCRYVAHSCTPTSTPTLTFTVFAATFWAANTSPAHWHAQYLFLKPPGNIAIAIRSCCSPILV